MVLSVSVDNILKNTWGLTVSCHKFRQVSDDLIKSLGVVLPRPIVWMLLLGGHCGG